jgi:Sulfotransferase family
VLRQTISSRAVRKRVASLTRRLRPGVLERHTAPELIITGISRSGTSYLCTVLHRLDNCVAINEPAEIISLLGAEEVPLGVPAFYRELRRKILAGKPIENKLLDGEVVEDTAVYQRRHEYTPSVAADDFVLAVKNTREFLFRLEAVRQVMPTARVVACVRDPFDTIASWKASFAHLRDADVTPFAGHPTQMWLSEQQRAALREIAATSDLPERRALWWRFQAERLLEHSERILLVDYNELVRQPMTVLRRLLSGYHPGRPRAPITSSVPRSKRKLLDDRDLRAIQTICSEVAAELQMSMRDRL